MYEAAPAPAADATLSDLRVDGVTIGDFDPATDSYTVTLAGDVTSIRTSPPTPPITRRP